MVAPNGHIETLLLATPEAVKRTETALGKELKALAKDPDKATKHFRETAKMANTPVPGMLPSAGGDPNATPSAEQAALLRAAMEMSQAQGAAQGKAMTKFQMTLMGLAITVLWSFSMGILAYVWNKQDARVSKLEDNQQTMLQEGMGQKAREVDYVRRLDKIETKQDSASEKLNEQKVQLNEILQKVNDLKK